MSEKRIPRSLLDAGHDRLHKILRLLLASVNDHIEFSRVLPRVPPDSFYIIEDGVRKFLSS